MIAAISKRIGELTAEDLQDLVEVELVSGGDLKIVGLSGDHLGVIKAAEMPLVLERISLGDRDEVMNSVLTDILDVCEYPRLPRPRLAINWT